MTVTGTPVTIRPRSWDEAMEVLAQAIPNYESRPEQTALAKAIESALDDDVTLVGQGGCGVGKSFAALVPAITSGKRTIYATATKALQDQIAQKDLPFLAEHFAFTHAVLKGRSNYLCRAAAFSLDDEHLKGRIMQVLPDIEIGERSEIPFPLDDREWADLTVSSEECPGKSQCEFGQGCFAEEAKRRAKDAQVVVVNHALLATDTVVKLATEGAASMIGEYDALIIDEAHEFEEFVGGNLETVYRIGGMRQLAVEFRNFLRTVNVDDKAGLFEEFNSQISDFFDWLPEGRLRHAFAVEHGDRFMAMIEVLHEMRSLLLSQDVCESLPGVDHAGSREDRMADRAKADKAKTRQRILANRTLVYLEGMKACLLHTDANTVRFVDSTTNRRTGQTYKVLKVRPVMVDEWLQENLWSQVRPVLISATLLVDGKADFINSRMGLTNPRVIDAGTPFDYQRQARLYIPEAITDPSDKRAPYGQRDADVLREIERLVRTSEGRALVLFTSKSAMANAYNALSRKLPYECRQQGDDTVPNLMSWFKADDGEAKVLFATRSFFTGIDVQGDSLSMVIIDKLPFPVPTEPVFEARCEEITRRGGNDFRDMTIPAMTLPLQQAFGRLIRTKTDTGVVAILDPRLHTKSYGKTIVRSLPAAPMVTSFQDVEQFFQG